MSELEKIIQITEVKGELWGLDDEGNVYKLFAQKIEVSGITDYWWIKCINKDKIKR